MKRKCLLIALLALLLTLLTACREEEHIHSYGPWKVTEEPTCEEEGVKTRSCDCGEKEEKKVSATGHDFGQWEVEEAATCTTAGKQSRTCDCGEIEEEQIPVGNHEYEVSDQKVASCQGDGFTTYLCSKCSDTYTDIHKYVSYTSTELYDLYLDTVGEVLTYDESGSGLSLGSCFVYGRDGVLVTNYHVIEDAYSVDVTIGGKKYEVEKVLAYDKNLDLAVLKIPASSLKVATICKESHAVGQQVYALGSSQGLTATFSEGIITYSDRESEGVHYVQHDAPISSGNSGGPLINLYGEVIGVNTLVMLDSQNLNFAVLCQELDKLDYSTPLTVPQLYEKESNAYKKLTNYIMEKGSYSDGSYAIELDTMYSTDYTTEYSFLALYDTSTNTVTFCVNDGGYYVAFAVDEQLSGVYDWFYWDADNYEMEGVLYANSFNTDTTLSYSWNNISYQMLTDVLVELSSVFMQLLCTKLTSCLSACGVTAADLGFVNF